jgi:hypothetical protein
MLCEEFLLLLMLLGGAMVACFKLLAQHQVRGTEVSHSNGTGNQEIKRDAPLTGA